MRVYRVGMNASTTATPRPAATTRRMEMELVATRKRVIVSAQLTGGPDVQEVLQDYLVKVWTYSDDLACRRNILEKRLRAITRMLVRCHRLRIEAVARTLLDRSSLSVEELDALMQCGNPDAILPSFDEHGCARA